MCTLGRVVWSAVCIGGLLLRGRVLLRHVWTPARSETDICRQSKPLLLIRLDTIDA
jgi:hypothetical protein